MRPRGATITRALLAIPVTKYRNAEAAALWIPLEWLILAVINGFTTLIRPTGLDGC